MTMVLPSHAWVRLPPLSGLALIVVGCATAARQPPAPPTGVHWTLTQLEGAPVRSSGAGREPGLQFATDGRVTGFTTCNHFFGRYDARGGGQLRFADLGSTKMACVDPELSRQEQRFMAALQRAQRFSVAGDTLVLLEGDNALARFAAGPAR